MMGNGKSSYGLLITRIQKGTHGAHLLPNMALKTLS
jgi:hypothetical protein